MQAIIKNPAKEGLYVSTERRQISGASVVMTCRERPPSDGRGN
jgi:hypothetical protein